MGMGERTYQVVAAVEVLPQGAMFTSVETPRLAALVGAGYLIDKTPQEAPVEYVAAINGDGEATTLKTPSRKRHVRKE